MDFSAPHIGFVIGSYALSVILILGLIVSILLRDAKNRSEAKRLEAERRREKPE